MSPRRGATARHLRVPGGPLAAGVALAAAVTVAAGCTGTGGSGDVAGDAAGEGAPPPVRDTPAERGPAATDLAGLVERVAGLVGPTRAEARSRRGEPADARLRTVPNRHVRGAVDTLVRLAWEGITARYHMSGANQKEFLTSATVTGHRLLRRLLGPSGPATREDLLRLFGEPGSAADGRWTYVCCPGRRGAEESLAFRLEGDSVAAVRAGFYVD